MQLRDTELELTDRKKQIMKVVIEDYIRTAEPVGSKVIASQMGVSVSSATIRNELSDLVEMGYLEQPHTSAGRIPSPKGYRLYVNELMERQRLSMQGVFLWRSKNEIIMRYWAWTAARPRPRSKKPTASWRRKTIPT